MRKIIARKTKKIIIISLLSSCAVVIASFKIIIPGLCRISFDGPFYKFISIIWGPFYGSISASLVETTSVLLNPAGHYTLLFSLTAAMRGFLSGFIWKFLSRLVFLKSKFLKLSITVFVSDCLVCFLNSLIIKFYLCQTEKTFLCILSIRFIKEFILIILNIVILSIMLDIHQKIIKK